MQNAWPFSFVKLIIALSLWYKREAVTQGEPIVIQQEKILVIDDEEFILHLSRDILEKNNYAITIAQDGRQGISLIEKERFDLILTDIKMPDMDGIDVIRHIRSGNKEIPIIVITGYGTLDTAINALRLGAQGFLLKPFTPADLRNAVAEALEKTRLLSENIRMRALMPLFEVSKEIIGEVNPKRLVRLLVEIARKEAHADSVCLALIDEETGRLDMKECHGLSQSCISAIEDSPGDESLSMVFMEKKPFLFTRETVLSGVLEGARQTDGIASGIFVPLTIRGTVIGILSIMRTSNQLPFTLSDVEFVSVLSGQAAAAIENARLYEKLQQSYLSTIITLSAVVEAKDLYTDKHMKDIAEYSVEIARKLGIADAEIEDIRKGALLHDLGKISVPDHILMKAGKLSDEEIAVIKKHPANGAKMIEPVAPLKSARDIIKHHQECFDGSGYPDGLRGEEIPLGARIVGIADAFGAMTTDRPYRKALTTNEAVRELRKYAGIQFDPDIVQIFISVLREKGIQNTGAEEL
jgi:putative nucleotidyltransferase with HDIG domain